MVRSTSIRRSDVRTLPRDRIDCRLPLTTPVNGISRVQAGVGRDPARRREARRGPSGGLDDHWYTAGLPPD